MESLQLTARVVATKHDLCHLEADALAQLDELGVLVETVEFARVVHEFFIAVYKKNNEIYMDEQSSLY